MASKTPTPAPDFTKMRKAKPPTMSAKTMKSIVSGATKVTSKLKMRGKVKDLDKDGDSKKDTDNDGM